MATLPPIVWDRCHGAIETLSPWLIPDAYGAIAYNVDLGTDGVMRPRPGYTALTGPESPLPVPDVVYNMFTERTSGVEALWIFGEQGGTLQAWRLLSGTWTSWTLIDTPATNSTPSPQVVACAYNGKVFVAYNSSSNRLHLYDTEHGDTVYRRVGVSQASAPSVANTGSGSYAAVIRYYKVQFGILSGTSIIASGELSSATSFTPSGSGTAARVTKPTNVDSATHWRVFVSSDGLTYYELDDWIAVGTTTKDDSYTVDLYPTNPDVAPEAGLFVPPPSAKFLATNGERLFMAGAYESSAASTETAISHRRIWFTRPLGATDRGDDESITQTSTAAGLPGSRYWIDLDAQDSSRITGLVSTLDGSIYAGTATGLWRLYDTGQVDKPIRAERVVEGVGPTTQLLMTVAETVDGSWVYFGGTDGPYRYSPRAGVQYLGSDWVLRTATGDSENRFAMFCCQWDPLTRRVYWIYSTEDTFNGKMRTFDPALVSLRDGVWRGGWTTEQFVGSGTVNLYCATIYGGRIYLGGQNGVSPTGVLLYRDPTSALDLGANAVTASVLSKTWIPDEWRNVRTEDPYVYRKRAQEVAMTMTRNRGGAEENPAATSTIAAATPSAPLDATHERTRAENLVVADAYCFNLRLTMGSPSTSSISSTAPWDDGVARVVIPVFSQERG